MITKDQFRDEDSLTDVIGKFLAQGKVACVLGAGASKQFGLPDWDALIKKMCEFASVDWELEGQDNLKVAERLKHEVYQGNVSDYMDAVQAALYENAKMEFADLRGNAALAGVASVVMAVRRGGVSDVITYNFDNCLETYLEFHGFDVEPIMNHRHWAVQADVRVYHPHGFLPREGMPRSRELVLDRESYSQRQNRDPWEDVVKSVMRRNFCIFVGVSGEDSLMDSTFLDAKDAHATNDGSCPYWGVTFARDDDKGTAATWARRGIHYQVVDNYETHLPLLLFRSCQKAAGRRRGG